MERRRKKKKKKKKKLKSTAHFKIQTQISIHILTFFQNFYLSSNLNYTASLPMSGTHQSMIVCERILSMVEGDPEVVSHFNVLDSILLLSQAYSKINIKKFHHKIQNEGAGLQIVDTNTRLVKPSTKRKSKHILPPRGMNANAIKQEQQRISEQFAVVCLKAHVSIQAKESVHRVYGKHCS